MDAATTGDPAICNCKWHLIFEQIATQTTKFTAIYDHYHDYAKNLGVEMICVFLGMDIAVGQW